MLPRMSRIKKIERQIIRATKKLERLRCDLAVAKRAKENKGEPLVVAPASPMYYPWEPLSDSESDAEKIPVDESECDLAGSDLDTLWLSARALLGIK